ncbi:MAG: hypothetical protein RR705_08885 [Lachnospiraceae bacterium]
MYEILFYFYIYGFLGWCTEVAYAGVKEGRFVNRGFLNGPICPIYGVGVSIVILFLGNYKEHVVILYLASVILVTILEWMTGLILEKVFHHRWWDYSNRPLNIHGYVCLLFSMIWGAACVLIVKFIHPLIQVGIDYVPIIVGVIVLVVCSLGMFADLWVTTVTVQKMNRGLEKMQEIAKELHRISDELGESIFQEVSEAKEKTEEVQQKIFELKDMKAFPKMQSKDYKESFEDLRSYLKRK